MAITLVSPIEPGMKPQIASHIDTALPAASVITGCDVAEVAT